MALRPAGLRLATLLVLQAAWLGAVHSQQPAAPAFASEISRQEAIYRGTGNEAVDGYTVDRGLREYTYALPAGFDRVLESLGPGDRWLDIGAGKGQAILDYFAPGHDTFEAEARERRDEKAQVIAISIEDRRTLLWQQTAAHLEVNKMQYLYDRRLEEYTLDELGKFRVITDVIGGFSYTDNLSQFVEKVLEFLDLNGSFYTLLQDVRSEAGANRPHYAGSQYLTEVTGANGSEGGICSWLKSISCVEVTCEFATGWTPPVEKYRIRKICNGVNVPALLPVTYTAGTPPERRFQVSSPPEQLQAVLPGGGEAVKPGGSEAMMK